MSSEKSKSEKVSTEQGSLVEGSEVQGLNATEILTEQVQDTEALAEISAPAPTLDPDNPSSSITDNAVPNEEPTSTKSKKSKSKSQSKQKKSLNMGTDSEASTTLQTQVDERSVPASEAASDQENEDVNGDDEGSDTEEDVKSAIEVNTVYLEDATIGLSFSDYPIAQNVLFALNEQGHNLVSRYQQIVLNAMMSGEDAWFSINLASNRGTVIGTYLVDSALSALDQTTIILCVAVPKIRAFFYKDLLALAKYTPVKIACIQDSIEGSVEEYQFTDVPNILIASIEDVVKLEAKLDMSHIQVVYFDEIEKTLRDNSELLTDFCTRLNQTQVLLQSSYYSENLVSNVHQFKPLLQPTRIFKQRGFEGAIRCFIEPWAESLASILQNDPMATFTVISEKGEELHGCSEHLRSMQWTTAVFEEGSVAVVQSEARPQILFMTVEQWLQHKEVESVHLVLLSPCEESLEAAVLKRNRRSAVWLCGYEKEVFSEKKVEHIQITATSWSRAGVLIQNLRSELYKDTFIDWGAMVEEIMSEPDGAQLMGVALQLYFQQERSMQAEISSNVYKLEGRDIFQRRHFNRRKR